MVVGVLMLGVGVALTWLFQGNIFFVGLMGVGVGLILQGGFQLVNDASGGALARERGGNFLSIVLCLIFSIFAGLLLWSRPVNWLWAGVWMSLASVFGAIGFSSRISEKEIARRLAPWVLRIALAGVALAVARWLLRVWGVW